MKTFCISEVQYDAIYRACMRAERRFQRKPTASNRRALKQADLRCARFLRDNL